MYSLPILVWNRTWFSRELRECVKVFVVSIPNGQERKGNTVHEFEVYFKKSFIWHSNLTPNLSNDDIIC